MSQWHFSFQNRFTSAHLLINQFYLLSHEQQYYFTDVANTLYSEAVVQRSEAATGGFL